MRKSIVQARKLEIWDSRSSLRKPVKGEIQSPKVLAGPRLLAMQLGASRRELEPPKASQRRDPVTKGACGPTTPGHAAWSKPAGDDGDAHTDTPVDGTRREACARAPNRAGFALCRESSPLEHDQIGSNARSQPLLPQTDGHRHQEYQKLEKGKQMIEQHRMRSLSHELPRLT